MSVLGEPHGPARPADFGGMMSQPTHPSGADGEWQQGPDGQWRKAPPEQDAAGGPVPPAQAPPGQAPPAQTSPGQVPPGQAPPGSGSGAAGGPAARPAAQPGVPVGAGEEQGWGVAMHLGGVFLSWLVPLVLWLVFRERSRMLDDHGKEALNFQITLFIAYIVGAATTIILIGFLILFLAWVLSVVFSILAAIAAYNRRPYRYPLTIRFIK
ncbi:DUF4870 domain-containing protein [Nesterenkonia sp. LB17]|uniref:DUF4870 domain-containing protein n=1 Tax=unclassified Nesterenkonia TaxID=2629769 RepID=UPI001F4C80C6|nr:DUF4870 domain-containing protein [Nesterenkonia sp. LB17]MCH8570008.1 DUF4870 domain-containing protein [Nesterenkonia sp. AY15]